MLENILNYERDLFLLLNSYHSPFLDLFMWLFSGKIAWAPVSVLFVVILSYKNKLRWKEIVIVFVAIALVITMCDQFASGFCKPFFERFRPTHHPDFMNEVNTVFDYRGGRYGFISSHAANAFGFATLTSLIFRNKFYSIMILTWATINSYSRIYLGVHFISDIVAGMIVGILFGWIVYKLAVRIHLRFTYHPQKRVFLSLFPCEGIGIIAFALILTIAVLAIISTLYSLNIIPEIAT